MLLLGFAVFVAHAEDGERKKIKLLAFSPSSGRRRMYFRLDVATSFFY